MAIPAARTSMPERTRKRTQTVEEDAANHGSGAQAVQCRQRTQQLRWPRLGYGMRQKASQGVNLLEVALAH